MCGDFRITHPIIGGFALRFSCEAELDARFGTGDRDPGICSTLPGWDMIDRLEIVLQPSTRVAAPEMTLSPADEMGPGSIMSPEMTGKESTRDLSHDHLSFKTVHDEGWRSYLRGNMN